MRQAAGLIKRLPAVDSLAFDQDYTRVSGRRLASLASWVLHVDQAYILRDARLSG